MGPGTCPSPLHAPQRPSQTRQLLPDARMRPKSGGPVTAGGGKQGRSPQVQTPAWWQPPPNRLMTTNFQGKTAQAHIPPTLHPTDSAPQPPALLSPQGQDPSGPTSLGLSSGHPRAEAVCPALRPRRPLGVQGPASACLDRTWSAAPGLSTQGLLQGTFCAQRLPVIKATPCRTRGGVCIPRVPHSYSGP